MVGRWWAHANDAGADVDGVAGRLGQSLLPLRDLLGDVWSRDPGAVLHGHRGLGLAVLAVGLTQALYALAAEPVVDAYLVGLVGLHAVHTRETRLGAAVDAVVTVAREEAAAVVRRRAAAHRTHPVDGTLDPVLPTLNQRCVHALLVF